MTAGCTGVAARRLARYGSWMKESAASDTIPVRWVLTGACAAAFIAAVLVSSQIQLSMSDHGHDWWRLFAWQLAGWGYWICFSLWLLSAGDRLSDSSIRPLFRWLREAAMAFGLTTLHLPLVAGAFTLLQPYIPVDTYSFGEALNRSFRSWFHIDLLIYCLGAAISYGLAGYREARRAELRESRLETELARAQLDTLRLQIQPHFLFNTLNSIAALVRRKSNGRALEMVLGLSELLRSSLERSRHALVPLADELEFVKRYVELQRARFADRLSVDYDIDETCLEHTIPNFLLQPLVENAIRHGIGKRVAPGRIEIRAHRDQERLVIAITDDGVGLPAGFELTEHAGVGLTNTRSRLAQLYGERAEMTLSEPQQGGVTVIISLPIEPCKEDSLPRRAAVG